MNLTSVLLKPLLTEKTTMLRDEDRQVGFLINPLANKIEVKQAVEAAFDVKVESVNIVRRAPSNRKRQGRIVGRKPGWKKAYVKLAAGDKIEFFEGV